jgi:hypothetical protein
MGTVGNTERRNLNVDPSAPKPSSGATFVAMVQPSNLGKSDNPSCRGRLHEASLGTILVKGKMCSRLGILARPAEVRRIPIGTCFTTPRRSFWQSGKRHHAYHNSVSAARFLRAKSNLLCPKCIRASAVRFRSLLASPMPKLIRGAVPVDFSICSFAYACDKRSKAICAENGNVRTREIKCPASTPRLGFSFLESSSGYTSARYT